MANKTIHELTPASTVDSDYEIAVYDIDGNGTKKATADQILKTSSLLYAYDDDEPTGEVDFTSQDTTLTPSSSTSVDLLSGNDSWSQRFVKISQMFKNVRFLLSKLGTADISSIGNGTVTGAISVLNSNLTTVEKNTYSYSNNGNITEIGASKIGKIVTITVSQRTAGSWTRGQYITLTTLDTKYRPTMGTLNFPIVDNSTTTSSEGTIGIGQVTTDGTVKVWLYNNISRNSAIRGTVTYIID